MGRHDGSVLLPEIPAFDHLTGNPVDLILLSLQALEFHTDFTDTVGEAADIDPLRTNVEASIAFPVPPIMMPNGDRDFPWKKIVHFENRPDLITAFKGAELGEDSYMGDLDLTVGFIELIESRLELLNCHYLFIARSAAFPG